MFYLLATILLNVVLFIIFKLFPRYNINALQAIVANYWTCAITGSFLSGRYPVGTGSVHQPWFWWALLMGAMFISLFNLIAYCTKVDGITTTTIANKLSLVIPVIFSLFLYGDRLNAGKAAGIILAFPAVYLTTRVKEEGRSGQNLWLPALLFLGSGLLDTMVKYVEENFLQDTASLTAYTIHVFSTAALIGSILVTVQLIKNKTPIHYRNLIAGVILGVPNYFSIYYLIRLLNSDFMQSSAAIPVNNIGIVVASALTAIMLFGEKASTQRIIGLILSIVAILLIAFSDINGPSA